MSDQKASPGQALVSRFRSELITDWSALADAIDEMVAWRPIESVPDEIKKRGTQILIGYFGPVGPCFISDCWSEDHECWVDWGGSIPPALWLPLPLPPSGEKS